MEDGGVIGDVAGFTVGSTADEEEGEAVTGRGVDCGCNQRGGIEGEQVFVDEVAELWC